MPKMFDELRQFGRRCWSCYGPCEFFGFVVQDGIPMAVVKVDEDHSIRIIEIQSLRLMNE